MRVRDYWLLASNSSVYFFWRSLVCCLRDTLYLVLTIFEKTHRTVSVRVLTRRLIIALEVLGRFGEVATTHTSITIATELCREFLTLTDSTASLTFHIVSDRNQSYFCHAWIHMLVCFSHGFSGWNYRLTKLIFLGLMHLILKLGELTEVITRAWLLEVLIKNFLALVSSSLILKDFVSCCFYYLGASLS